MLVLTYVSACIGSCWAFATAAALEALPPIFDDVKLRNLSVQQLIACSKEYGNHGCISGRTITAIRYVREHGIVTEDRYPYQSVDDQSCNTKLERSPDVMISDYELVPEFDELALAKAVYHQPVTVMHATSKEFYRYAGGIFSDSTRECAGNKVSHSSLIVGYGTTPDGVDYWIFKNSWGEFWGDHGYIKVLRNTKKKLGRGICNLAHLAVYPVR